PARSRPHAPRRAQADDPGQRGESVQLLVHQVAVRVLEETLRQRKVVLGPDHPDTVLSIANLVVAYRTAGRVAEAVPLLEEPLGRMKAEFGPDHPDTINVLGNLGKTYCE